MPRGINLSAADYEEFFKKRDESKLLAQNKEKNNSSYDPLFDFLSDDKKNITSFDLILCNSNRGSQSSPDKDLIELSGIEKSKLRLINERINEISREISNERKNFIHANNELFPLNIEYSFQQILGMPLCDPNTGKVSFKISPKYQSHILKVLPLIYTDNYTHDEELLSSFIQNVEFSIRADDQKFIFLKYDLKFLLKIQNTKIDKFMEITSSESYQIGFLLGTMAKNLSQINSFEKNYVGNLRRRIATLADFIKLKNEIEEKLILHDKTKFTSQTSYELAQKIKEFKSKYDKDECAFGFFEGYFKPIPSRGASTSEEINSNINQ